jgi:N-methylhydantoinase A
VHFDADAVETAIYHRPTLGAGQVVLGPAVIEEFSSTVPIHPGFGARVDEFGNLMVQRK